MRLVEGSNGLSVRELTIADVQMLTEKAWKKDRAQILETLNESNASPAMRFEKLREHDRIRGTRIPLSYDVVTDKGAGEVIEAACTKDKVSFADFTAGMSLPQRQDIVRDLLGIMFRETTPGEAQADSGSLAPNP